MCIGIRLQHWHSLGCHRLETWVDFSYFKYNAFSEVKSRSKFGSSTQHVIPRGYVFDLEVRAVPLEPKVTRVFASVLNWISKIQGLTQSLYGICRKPHSGKGALPGFNARQPRLGFQGSWRHSTLHPESWQPRGEDLETRRKAESHSEGPCGESVDNALHGFEAL